ncbi:MAG: tyrosine-type recombinase/integrase [Actinomycetes bacterium]
MARNPNRTSTVYKGADGYWHGRVTVGYRDDGSEDRRHTMSKSKSVVVQKVRALEKLRDAGQAPKVGERWTFDAWLDHWLELIARPGLRVRSYEAYRGAVWKHLVPGLGKQRLDRLEPEHLERLYRRMIDQGASPGTAHQVHRTARTALGEAQRRGHVIRNVAALARAPRVRVEPPEPFSVTEVQKIMNASTERPNSARWAVALALGLRQGEALGLRWSDIDLDTHTLRVRSTRQRPRYEHGCGGACGKKAGFCPQRRQTNDQVGETKSAAGQRVVGLPDQLVQLLKLHREEQDQARARAGQLWCEGGWVFASPTGEALNPNTDYRAWKALLKDAGVRDARLHDARHTAATALLVLGVPERTVMSIMGWSSTSMAARYQHVTDPIRRDVAQRLGGLIWSDDDKSSGESNRNEP